jgi:hypothetical protein
MTHSERHKTWLRIAEGWKREREARPHGPYTANPEPPGDGWASVLDDVPAFASAGLCELWRMDWGDQIQLGCFNDLPPWLNVSGLWWRKAAQPQIPS